jgi:hypothetical protein
MADDKAARWLELMSSPALRLASMVSLPENYFGSQPEVVL